MARGKYEAPRKRSSPLGWVLLFLVIFSVVNGSVIAYLSASANPATNRFAAADHPQATVHADNSITVSDPGYAVYLRAAVTVNWKNGNDILAQMPVEGEDYSVTLGGGWKKIDEFYYYTSAIDGETMIAAPVIVSPVLSSKDGYNLTVTVIAQAVQAVGRTDDGTKTAVEDAWGVPASAFITQNH